MFIGFIYLQKPVTNRPDLNKRNEDATILEMEEMEDLNNSWACAGPVSMTIPCRPSCAMEDQKSPHHCWLAMDTASYKETGD